MAKPKILVFTGAGVSKESVIETFRDAKDGLWNNYSIKDVASIDGWKRDKQLVIDFYNKRREDSLLAKPNLAHDLIAKLEEEYDVTVVTQNVDYLHEQAGTTNGGGEIIHLHGRLDRLRSTLDPKLTYSWDEPLKLGDKCDKGSQLRPDIIFFGEALDEDALNAAEYAARKCDVCIIVGTSMQVYPAADLPFKTKESTIIYYVDPSDINFYVPTYRKIFFYHIQKPATLGMQEVFDDLKNLNL